MVKITSLFCLLLSMTSLVSAQQPAKKTQVFLLAGQSNMDGRADAGKISAEDLHRL